MAAKRPVILAALQALLKAGVPAVANRVYLPWDNQPQEASQPIIEIVIEESRIESELIGVWTHTVPVRLGAVRSGKFDYPAVWEILNAAAAAILADSTLAGQAESITVTGGGDHLEVAGNRILWPHLAAEIIYRTDQGAL